MLTQAATAYGLMLLALLPMMNPPTTAVLLLGISSERPVEWVQRECRKVALYVFVTLLVAYFLGAGVLQVFNISLPSLQLAGGVVVAYIGFRMLFPPAGSGGLYEGGEDSAFVPLTIPSLCGPGTLALVLSAAVEVDRQVTPEHRLWIDAAIVAAFATAAGLAWATLRLALPVQRILGRAGIDALTRIMGFLLVCIGFQLIIGGVRAVLFVPPLAAGAG